MTYFLDTNICIYYLKGTYSAVAEHLLRRHPAEIAIPAIVKAELLLGARKSGSPEKSIQAVTEFLLPFRTVPFDEAGADHYASVRADLENRGEPIGPNDLIVAATALAHGAVLITNNEREFARIGGLQTENWTR